MSITFWVWLSVIVLTVILEAATMDLVSIWFTIGAIVPFIMSAAHDAGGWVWQLVIFFVVSATLIFALRPFAKKWLTRNAGKTNLDTIIGQNYRLINGITFDKPGSVKINDVVWTAVCEDRNTSIEAGTIVEVVQVSGNKMVVKPSKTKEDKK